LIAEDLEMAADRRLRELEDMAGLRDAELMTLQQAEKPKPRGVGEDLHPGEQGIGLSGWAGHL
jgi:hypothetical protein